MNVTMADALREVLRRRRITQVQLCEKMGYASTGSITSPIYRGDMKVSTFMKILDACGYKITVSPYEEIDPEYPESPLVLIPGK